MKHVVSVIIPAFNEEKIIGKAIKSMKNQRYPYKEILVMDNASTDRTAEIAKKLGVKVITNKKNVGIGNSVNIGIKNSKGKFIILLHADHYTEDRNWIGKMLEPFSDPAVGAVVSQRRNKKRGEMSFGEKVFDSLHPPNINTRGTLAEISTFREKADAYRKDVLVKLGYFDGNSYPHGGEDVDMSIKMRRAGYKIVLSDKAIVEHVFSSHQSSLVSVFRKGFQMGQAGRTLYKKYRIDSIRRRMFLMILFSLLILPIAYTDVGATLYLLIFILGIFTPINMGKLRLPVSILSFVISLAVYYTYSQNFPLVTGVIIAHTAIITYYGMHSVRNSLKYGDSVIYTPIIFFLAILWRFVSAVGYMKEELLPSEI